MRKTELTDGLVALLIQLVHKISVRAERKVEGEISAEFRRVHGKNGILVRLAQAALDLPEHVVREAIYPVVGARTPPAWKAGSGGANPSGSHVHCCPIDGLGTRLYPRGP
ncbi:hypothetical protein ABZ297_26500 [Nonomuraea sp. NPDC005983]|uniref:hypothetical protein n=1 Tax=Nonomuraea sp. NPDC005983 TaxID=3155595 RepID=UPI0033A24301